jgi:hypothetical protein
MIANFSTICHHQVDVYFQVAPLSSVSDVTQRTTFTAVFSSISGALVGLVSVLALVMALVERLHHYLHLGRWSAACGAMFELQQKGPDLFEEFTHEWFINRQRLDIGEQRSRQGLFPGSQSHYHTALPCKHKSSDRGDVCGLLIMPLHFDNSFLYMPSEALTILAACESPHCVTL